MPALTNYTGNAGLGSGSNPQIPVSDTGKGLEPLIQAGRDAMILNVENQRQLYQQKVKDHDQLLKLISSGDLQVGALLDRDRDVVKKSLDSLDTAWTERGKRGFNDIDAAVKYNKALRDAQQSIFQAQSRYVVDRQVEADAAKEEDPAVRDEMLKGHDQYLGGFWNDYKPYVRAQTLDHPGLLQSLTEDALVSKESIGAEGGTQHRMTRRIGPDGKVTVWDTTTNKPATAAQQKAAASQGTTQGLSLYQRIPGKYYDFNKILSNTADRFHDFKQRKNMELYMDYLLNKADNFQLGTIVDTANKRFTDYNDQRGFKPGDEGYITQMRVGADNNGQKHFFDSSGVPLSMTEANARMALASIGGDYVEKDKYQFDKEAGNYLIAKQKADADSVYKRLMAGAAGTRARAYADNLRNQMKHRDSQDEKDAFLNEMYKRNLTNQESLIGNEVTPLGRKDAYTPIEADKSLPIFTLEGGTVKQLIPIGATPMYPEDAYTGEGKDKVLKSGVRPLYYKGGHFDQSYQLNGKDVPPAQMQMFYNVFKNQYEKQTGTPWEGGIDKFLKESIKNNRFRVLLKGENGTVDEDLSRAAQMIISNKNTTKGEQGVFDYPDEQLVPEENQ